MNIYEKILKLTTVFIPPFLLFNVFGFESLLGAVLPTTDFPSVFCRTTDFPVLMYHHIRNYDYLESKAAQNLSVSPREFQDQLEYLKDKGYKTIVTKDLQNGMVPCGSIMIIFDDGYEDVHKNALPLMRKYNFSGVVSLIISNLDEMDYMSGNNVRELQNAGWQIASHTWSHPILTNIHLIDMLHEIRESKMALERWFHTNIDTFVYPGGYYGPEALTVVKNSGYKYAFTTAFGQAQLGKKSLELRRINMLPGTTPEKLGILLEKAREATIQ